MTVDISHFHLPQAGGVAHIDHPQSERIFRVHEGGRLRDRHNEQHVAEDLELLKLGVLDPHSLISGYQEQTDPIRVLVHDKKGRIKHARYSHNLRMNTGGVWVCELMGGGVNLGTSQQLTASSATSATSATTTAPTANQYVGHIIVATVSATSAVYGKIVSHTTTTTPVFTVDQWYSVGSASGAAGSTPSATGTYVILPGRGFAPWLAFTSTASFTPNTTDTQGSGWSNEITTGALGRQFGTYSLTTNPTASSTSTNTTAAFKFHLGITLTGTIAACDGAGLFEYAGQGNGNPVFEASFTNFAGATNDTVTCDWTFTNN